MSFLKSFWRDESGFDLSEYGLLIAFAALIAVALIFGFGGSVGSVSTATGNMLTAAEKAATGGSK